MVLVVDWVGLGRRLATLLARAAMSAPICPEVVRMTADACPPLVIGEAEAPFVIGGHSRPQDRPRQAAGSYG